MVQLTRLESVRRFMAVERRLFHQALNVVLEVLLNDDLGLDNSVVNFRRTVGNPG